MSSFCLLLYVLFVFETKMNHLFSNQFFWFGFDLQRKLYFASDKIINIQEITLSAISGYIKKFISAKSFNRPNRHPREKRILKFLFLILQQIEFTLLVANVFHVFVDFLYRVVRQKRNIHENPALILVQFDRWVLLQNAQNVQLLRFGHLLYLVL